MVIPVAGVITLALTAPLIVGRRRDSDMFETDVARGDQEAVA